MNEELGGQGAGGPHRDPGRDAASGAGRGGAEDLRRALSRLEKVVEKLAATASGAIAGRAAAVVDEMTGRLERDFGRRASSKRRRRHERQWSFDRPAARRLSRDRRRAKIAGVCAGIANFYGMEPWVVRCMAVTGLIFLPSIVFPAYWILFFVMHRSRGRERCARRPAQPPDGGLGQPSEAPEFGAKLSPRRSLRNVRADLMQAELRLRRMEFHVTSGQYELQKEFNELDDRPARG